MAVRTRSALAARPRAWAGPAAHPGPPWPQRLLVVVVVLAAFGPYVVGSIRTEQLVVYGLLVATLPVALPGLQTRFGLRLLVPWALLVAVASLSLLPGASASAPYPSGSLLAGLDNLLLPIALLLLVWTLVPARHAADVLRVAAGAIALCAAANAVVAIVGVAVDLSPVLAPFWTGDGGGDSVAALAAELGRLGGIFNQPVEAGIAYGIGGLSAIHAFRDRPILLGLLVALVTVGGLLSVSKAFILGAMPIVLGAWLWSQPGRRRVVAAVVALLAVLGLLASGLVDRWVGRDYLARLVDPSGGLLDLYSAGRFTERSTFSTVVADALAHSPVVGVGPAGWAVPYDGAVAEALVVAGIPGLVLLACVLVGMLTLARTGGAEGRLALLVVVVVAGGCLGFSPLTANRVSTLVWLLVALLVLVRAHRASDETTMAAPVRDGHRARGE